MAAATCILAVLCYHWPCHLCILLFQGCEVLASYLLELVCSDDDRLTDNGQDRTYQCLSRMLLQIYAVIEGASNSAKADEVVSIPELHSHCML